MSTAAAAVQRFFRANARVCGYVEGYLPQTKPYLPDIYVETVARYMNSLSAGGIVVDVGGGKTCRFADRKAPGSSVKIIGVDVSEEELRDNRDVDEKLVADVVKDIPLSDEEADLVVSRSVLEHLTNVESFVRNAKRVLKSGGYHIHVFPSRFAPFSLINQALPKTVSKRLIHFVAPTSKGRLGFPAFYDHCYPSAMRRLLEKHHFELVETRVSYYQSDYFDFFVPLYLLSALYELGVYAVGAENLAATALIVARKP